MDVPAVTKFAFIIALTLVAPPFYSVRSAKNDPYRLPNATYPIHYDIRISTEIDRSDFEFSGSCFIKIQTRESVKEIVLHSKDADISKVELLSGVGNIEVENFTQNNVNEFLTINVKSELMKGETYELRIWYTSRLGEDKLGFYRSSYMGDNGKTVWLAATQFAPTQARHAFPCYDEPQLKATFKVEITHPTNLKAISNTDRDETVDNYDGTVTTKFRKTQEMSTYLVGFVVSDFDSDVYNSKSFNQEVYARKNGLNRTKFSGKFGLNVLQHFMDYFREDFPIDTMKHVAIPDFYFSGMENWGMVTYKENIFLFDSEINSVSHMTRAITLISHEMAHSWFGNLVTMKWWTFVWLKEGFSTLYAYYGADAMLPDIDMIELFITEKLQTVFLIDGKESTRPMTHYVEKQPEIMENYDKIAYDKAACVLRMIDHALGQKVFKTAVKSYLKNHKFKTVDEDNLFQAFKEVAPRDFPVDIMVALKTWTSQKGYPVLTVTRHYDTPALTITQERFLNNGDVDEFSFWHIPINIEIESENINFTNTNPDFWITTRTEKITPEKFKPLGEKWSPSKWIIFNKQQTGYYRVNYDAHNWKLITKGLLENHNNIHVINRAQLIDDAFALADAGRLNYSIALNLTKYLKNEFEYSPWVSFSTGIKSLKKHFHGTLYYTGFAKFVREIIDNPLSNVGTESKSDDPPLRKLMRNIILMHACEFDVAKCRSENLSPKDPDIRAYYYCDLMRKNSKNAYLEGRKILRSSQDTYLRSDVLFAFGCSREKSMLHFFLSSSIEQPSDLKLSREERLALLKSIYTSGPLGFNLTLHFLSIDWKAVKYTFPASALDDVIIDLAKYVNTPKLKYAFEVMLGNMNLPSHTLILAKTHITSNMRWNMLHKEEFESFLINAQGRLLSPIGLTLFIILKTLKNIL